MIGVYNVVTDGNFPENNGRKNWWGWAKGLVRVGGWARHWVASSVALGTASGREINKGVKV